MIFFIYLLILSGFIFTRGFFSFNGVFILLLSIILLIFVTVKNKLFNLKLLSPQLLLLLLCVLSLVMYGGLYQKNILLILLSFILLTLNILLALFFVLNKNSKICFQVFLSMCALGLLLRIFMIWSSPSPTIDVYDYLKNGALGFVHGQNPYSIYYTKLYTGVTPDFYSYLPGMIFLTLPFVVIFQDPRFAIVAGELLIAFLIFRLSKKKEDGYLYSLLIFNNPISLYMIEQSYTEPLILFLILTSAWWFVRRKNYFLVFTLGLLIATKQYALFLLPLFWRLFEKMKSKIYLLGGSIIVAIAIIAPFYFWNPTDFIHDAVTLQFNFPPRYEGLTFFSLLYRFGINYNFMLGSSIIILFLLFAYTRKKVNLSLFFYLSSFIYLVLFFFNKWAFINYYYLISQLLLVSAILKENNL